MGDIGHEPKGQGNGYEVKKVKLFYDLEISLNLRRSQQPILAADDLMNLKDRVDELV